MISDIKDLREETNDFISGVKVVISTLDKKVDSLNDNINNSLIILINMNMELC